MISFIVDEAPTMEKIRISIVHLRPTFKELPRFNSDIDLIIRLSKAIATARTALNNLLIANHLENPLGTMEELRFQSIHWLRCQKLDRFTILSSAKYCTLPSEAEINASPLIGIVAKIIDCIFKKIIRDEIRNNNWNLRSSFAIFNDALAKRLLVRTHEVNNLLALNPDYIAITSGVGYNASVVLYATRFNRHIANFLGNND